MNTALELADRTHPAHEVVVGHQREFQHDLRRLAAEAGVAESDRLASALGVLVDGAIVTAFRDGTPVAVALLDAQR